MKKIVNFFLAKNMEIDFRRFSPCAKAPLRKTDQLVGYDLFLSETKIVRAHSCELIRTDLQIEIPITVRFLADLVWH